MSTASVVRPTLAVLALLIVTSPCNLSLGRDDQLPVFDGITTEFRLTESRIRKNQPLKVRATIRNTTSTTKVFCLLDFDIDARIYSNGQLLEEKCDKSLQFPLHELTLKPGETSEETSEVFTPWCYNLAPGQYSIRFNYNLRALQDDSLRTEYEKRYGHPEGGIVPWDERDHPFTIVE